MLWDLDWDLIDKHGFNPNVYGAWNTGGNNRALQYVIDGLKFQGCAPGSSSHETRSSRATEALGEARTPARSGRRSPAAVSASAPSRGRPDRDDNSEAFDTASGLPGGLLRRHCDPPDAQHGRSGDGRGDGVRRRGRPRPRHPGQQLPVLAAGRLHHPAHGDTGGGVHHAAAAADPGGDTGQLPALLRPGNGPLHVPVEDAPGVGRHLPRVRPHAGRRRSAPRLLPHPGEPRVRSLGQCARRRRPARRERHHHAAWAGLRDDDERRQRPLLVRAIAEGHVRRQRPRQAGATSPQTQTIDLSRPRTVDFTLPRRSDAFGYTCGLETAPFEQAATIVPITGDDVAGTIDLPFAFTFYGFSYTRAHVCTNGFIELVGPSTTNCSAANAAIPTTGRPNGAIYSFWDDTFVDAQASIRTETKGASPNRRFVIEFRNPHFFEDTSRRVDFNIVLHENGEIVTQYRNLADDGRERGNSATIGIENHTGLDALRVAFNASVLAPRAGGHLDPIPAAAAAARRTRSRAMSVTTQNQPIANATVTIEDTPITPATTDANGFYSFERVPEGTYSTTAESGCKAPRRRSWSCPARRRSTSRSRRLTDSFGYSCERGERRALRRGRHGPRPHGRRRVGPDHAAVPVHALRHDVHGRPCVHERLHRVWARLPASAPLTNAAIPTTGRPNGAIYAYWDDLFVDAEASIRTQLKGTAPNRRFVIEYRNVRYFGDTTRRIDFSLVLDENGQILTQYRNLANDGRERGNSATLGIENAAGDVALRFSFNQALLGVEPAVNTITYRPPA